MIIGRVTIHILPRNMKHPSLRVRSGVTLAELLVVLVIIGLVTGVAVVQMSGVTRQAKLEQTVGILVHVDSHLREHAIRFGVCGALRFDLSRGILRSLPGSEGAGRTQSLGNGVVIRRVMSATRDIAFGAMTVDYSCIGTTETYAVELESDGGDAVWVLFAGLSGQVTRFKDVRDVEEVLQAAR